MRQRDRRPEGEGNVHPALGCLVLVALAGLLPTAAAGGAWGSAVLVVLVVGVGAGLAWFVRRELRAQRADEVELIRFSAGGTAGIAAIVIAGIWGVAFPFAAMAARDALPALQAIPSSVLAPVCIVLWVAVPTAAVAWRSRLVGGTPAVAETERHPPRAAKEGDRVDLHEIHVMLDAADAGALVRAIEEIPRWRAADAIDALAAYLARGARASYARRPFAKSETTADSQIATARGEIASRSLRDRAGEGFRDAAMEPRGRAGDDGHAVVSLLIAAYPNRIAATPVTGAAALRARLAEILPLDPEHVLAIAHARCPEDPSRVLDEAEAVEAYPELSLLER